MAVRENLVTGIEMSWDTIIDLEQALLNCHVDLIRDWYYHPWGSPELDCVAM